MKISQVEWLHDKLEENAVYELSCIDYNEALFLKELLEKVLEKYGYEDREADIEVKI